ncbi:MAG: ABC transporter substrate-binding protein [Flavonifractor plautii]
MSEDGLTWTFALRGRVTFSDGSPLTAAEVAAS